MKDKTNLWVSGYIDDVRLVKLELITISLYFLYFLDNNSECFWFQKRSLIIIHRQKWQSQGKSIWIACIIFFFKVIQWEERFRAITKWLKVLKKGVIVMPEKFIKVTLSLLRCSAWAKQSYKLESESFKLDALHVKNDNIF